MKSSTYYFHIKTKILADFQICISVPLTLLIQKFCRIDDTGVKDETLVKINFSLIQRITSEFSHEKSTTILYSPWPNVKLLEQFYKCSKFVAISYLTIILLVNLIESPIFGKYLCVNTKRWVTLTNICKYFVGN